MSPIPDGSTAAGHLAGVLQDEFALRGFQENFQPLLLLAENIFPPP